MTEFADTVHREERLRRWRLVLGEGGGNLCALAGRDAGIDGALSALYGDSGDSPGEGRSQDRRGGLGASALRVARWLGDVRSYFPSSVVRVMQQDAMDRLGLRQMLLEPELLATVDADVRLAADLIALRSIMPGETLQTARLVVSKVLADLERRLAERMRQAVLGSLNRAARTRRPRHQDIDWDRTIRANLAHYLPDQRTVIPERLVGFGRRRSSQRDIVLCVDQSGSMATSVVYAGLFGAVLASLSAVRTRLVFFDTSVVDVSDQLADPVEVLFAAQLGGGTDINSALAYCQRIIERPEDTILVLISDLYEGGHVESMIKRAGAIAGAGVQFITLLALSDDGRPAYDHHIASHFASLGIPSFACTPDLFPELMAATINRESMQQWAGAHEVPLAAMA